MTNWLKFTARELKRTNSQVRRRTSHSSFSKWPRTMNRKKSSVQTSPLLNAPSPQISSRQLRQGRNCWRGNLSIRVVTEKRYNRSKTVCPYFYSVFDGGCRKSRAGECKAVEWCKLLWSAQRGLVREQPRLPSLSLDNVYFVSLDVKKENISAFYRLHQNAISFVSFLFCYGKRKEKKIANLIQ